MASLVCGLDMTKTDMFRHVGFCHGGSLLRKLIRTAGLLYVKDTPPGRRVLS